ncbi:MAG TPA: PfkB family carbohydrate kinase [Solirubrobacterales bacterium]
MLIAGPNLTVDRVIGVDRFDAGHIHHVRHVDARIGGGGPNAARTALQLGAPARLITLIPEPDLPSIPDALARDGIDVEWVTCQGNVRVATILREERGRMSVLNEPGPEVSAREWEAFAKLAEAGLRPGEVLLCSGSLPPGAPRDGYVRLARLARHNGSRAIIDVAGEALAHAIEEGEGLVVPNIAEAEIFLYGPREQAVHAEGDPPERALDAAIELLRRGAPRAVVTAGAAGAAYAEQGPNGLRGWVEAPRVNAVNPIGAGDAFAAALGLRLEAGDPLDEAVRFACAAAAAHVESPHRVLSRERAEELADSVPTAA